MTTTSTNHYHSSRPIGKIHQPVHAFFSNARRLTEGTHIIRSLEGELCVSDSLDDSRGADEESELSSVLSHLVTSEWLCQAKPHGKNAEAQKEFNQCLLLRRHAPLTALHFAF
jgi:hypothetical protein